MTAKTCKTLEEAKILWPEIPLGHAKDLRNQRKERLVFLYRCQPAENHKVSWVCKCDCGNFFRKNSISKSKSCGCLQKEILIQKNHERKQDLIGQRFFKLTVLKPVNKSNKVQYWECQCDCGRKTVVSGLHLKFGDIKSCNHCHYENLIGQKFGMLTVLKFDEETQQKYKNKSATWICQCDCGNKISMTSQRLKNDENPNCGCLRKISKGEEKIQNILEIHNIKFIHDKRYFKDLILPNGGIGRYDFILLNDMNEPYYLIEFDGKQHYEYNNSLWFNYTNFQQIQLNDKCKNEYAKKHNLPLARIPYYEIDKLNLELLFDKKYLI